ncbi:MAG: tRNA (adenosine(37)-N6)-threonylcarbamoyltransferase complex dimerization subunit type 1 TsaB [Burkholderiales bacterium]|nr:tRNA (adenosine(37)-N6)-threonylcarbamoyltransferase complex dimerization subunit type 1 TsaB [Burkholderiales bacterium]
MTVLAIESSTEHLSLAVARDGGVLESHQPVGQRHAELILPAIVRLLGEANTAIPGLTAIAFGAGPGSFTGLRIACGVAQGLALARGLPVLGVGTLEALAETSGDERVIACLDARMGEVYHAAYRRGAGRWIEASAPALLRPADVPLPEGDGWLGCGSGFLAHADALAAKLGGRLARVEPAAVPRASAILRLALPRFAAGAGRDPAEAVPLYVRDKVALKTHER